MEKTEEAVSVFENGFNCAQAVVAAFSEQTGLPEHAAYRIACGFGAGMGRRVFLRHRPTRRRIDSFVKSTVFHDVATVGDCVNSEPNAQ